MDYFDFKEAFLQAGNSDKSNGRLYFGFHNVDICNMNLTGSYYLSLEDIKSASKDLSIFYKKVDKLNRIEIRKTITGGLKLRINERNAGLENKITTLSREEYHQLRKYL